ncbi:hypothetical protein CBL_01856 [Carabus blaptoides fortunei]
MVKGFNSVENAEKPPANDKKLRPTVATRRCPVSVARGTGERAQHARTCRSVSCRNGGTHSRTVPSVFGKQQRRPAPGSELATSRPFTFRGLQALPPYSCECD